MSCDDQERELELTGPVKALAMLVIVLYHACAIYGGVWFGEPATPCPALGVFIQWLSTMHVPLFLLVSGYIWAYIKMETDKYDDACVVSRRKPKRLLVPYLFAGVVWAGPVYCFFYGPVSTVESFVLGNNPSQLWFLLALFWMFVFVELMWRIRPALLCKRDAVSIGRCCLHLRTRRVHAASRPVSNGTGLSTTSPCFPTLARC